MYSVENLKQSNIYRIILAGEELGKRYICLGDLDIPNATSKEIMIKIFDIGLCSYPGYYFKCCKNIGMHLYFSNE